MLSALEGRVVPAGYLAVGAGPGSLPWVAIRVDVQDGLGGQSPSTLGNPAGAPRSDGKTETTSQIFFPFTTAFRGGVNVATGNFDGLYGTPDSLVTAAGAGGGPHVIVWNTAQKPDGTIVVTGIRDQFFAYDARFRGGVHVTTGDLDGDGKAEIITGAGPGGGPHVRIWKEINGHFQVVNEFFAFDPNFRGGVNVASGQGYKTVVQQRFALSSKLPDDFAQVPYNDIPNQKPGGNLGIPLVGLDFHVPSGGTAFGNYTVPAGIEGHFDSNGAALPYFTVASGYMQYLSGNLLNSYNNIFYRPNVFIDPAVNTGMVGQLVYVKWSNGAKNFPGAPFAEDVTYGPFVRLSSSNDQTQVVTRLTDSPNQVTFKNQLVIGAGPGGGPHVKVYDFAGTAGGQLINNGVGKEFFAFDASFHGGVTVAVGDVIEHTDSSGLPERTDFTPAKIRPPVPDANTTSGTQAFINYPFDPELARRNTPEIVVGMASGGSAIRVFGDANPFSVDTSNPFSGSTPARRTALAQLNPQAFLVDQTNQVDPNNPFGGFYSPTFGTDFVRGTADLAATNGGVNVTVAGLNFGGGVTFSQQYRGTNSGPTGQTMYRGLGDVYSVDTSGNPLYTGGAIATNPVLGQLTVAAGVGNNIDGTSRGNRVRLFNEIAPPDPAQPWSQQGQYQPYDTFDANLSDPNTQGATVAFGFGRLPEPGLDVYYANYAATQGGKIALNALNPQDAPTLDDPILVTP